MWLRIGLITSAAEVAWPWLGCSVSLAARSGQSFNAVVDVLECKKWENN